MRNARDRYPNLHVEEDLRRIRGDSTGLQFTEALDEIDRLNTWKQEAMQVLADWDKVWEALGRPGPLGSSMAEESRKTVTRLLRNQR